MMIPTLKSLFMKIVRNSSLRRQQDRCRQNRQKWCGIREFCRHPRFRLYDLSIPKTPPTNPLRH